MASTIFFSSGAREMPEFIINAYRYGAFEKIDEFERFETRLVHATQKCWVSCETLFLNIVMNAKESGFVARLFQSFRDLPSPSELSHLSDNRDLQVLDTHAPTVPPPCTQREWLGFRIHLLQAIYTMTVGGGPACTAAESLRLCFEAFGKGEARKSYKKRNRGKKRSRKSMWKNCEKHCKYKLLLMVQFITRNCSCRSGFGQQLCLRLHVLPSMANESIYIHFLFSSSSLCLSS